MENNYHKKLTERELNFDDYKKSKKYVVNKFGNDVEDLIHDPMFDSIVEHLIRGEDPYAIIKTLVISRIKLINELQTFQMSEKLSPKFITRELYDKWHDEAIKEKRNESSPNLNNI